jgi:hemerythrin
MPYEWDQSLETGDERIDKQHKQLVAAVNDLLAACRTGAAQEELLRTLDFLTGYTIKHFSDEEKLQQQYNYPDYLNHKRYHDDFKVVATQLVARAVQEGPSQDLAHEVQHCIGDWLVNHIKGDDFKLAAYIKRSQNAAG